MTSRIPDGARVEMPDGKSWSVVRRHEMPRILTKHDTGERLLYVFFFADSGEIRRAEVPPDFPDPATLPRRALVDLWCLAMLMG
jgi:hypothetical protein